jgi:small subunit ribosomal protein S20
METGITGLKAEEPTRAPDSSQKQCATCTWLCSSLEFEVAEITGDPASIPTVVEVPVPRSKSAKKHQRQAKARTAANRAQRSALRSAVKAARAASPEQQATALKRAERLLDRAGQKRLIHPNTAARLKSRLSKKS